MSKNQPALHSMTGFGRSQDDWQGHRITLELSSVNGKFMDLSVHTPPGMSGLEVELRRLLGRAIQRGKVRCSVRLDGGEGGGAPLALRQEYVREYLRLYNEIKQTYGLEGSLTAETLLFAPEVVSTAEISLSDEAFIQWIEQLLNKALAALLKMRGEEGAYLRKELERSIDKMEELANQVFARAPASKENLRKRLLERLAEVREDASFPEERILQEVVLLAERTDIAEELARLASHVQQFRDSLSEGGPVGRRLDFLAQEMHREVNTIGSKTTEAAISSLVVYLKEELARVREQVQNIE
ncbi:MAG: YicC family protein [Candidatus Wallbacteria bacterium]|nr:YicC family protein [Candidatus Wallbacteria bacterium]